MEIRGFSQELYQSFFKNTKSKASGPDPGGLQCCYNMCVTVQDGSFIKLFFDQKYFCGVCTLGKGFGMRAVKDIKDVAVYRGSLILNRVDDPIDL